MQLGLFDDPKKLEPVPGKVYRGKSVVGTVFTGEYRFTTGSGLWALCQPGDPSRRLIALIMPETAVLVEER